MPEPFERLKSLIQKPAPAPSDVDWSAMADAITEKRSEFDSRLEGLNRRLDELNAAAEAESLRADPSPRTDRPSRLTPPEGDTEDPNRFDLDLDVYTSYGLGFFRGSGQADRLAEAERVRREIDTLEMLRSMLDVAQAEALASATRQQASDERETRMVSMTDTLVTVTFALVVLAFFTLIASILAVIVAA